MVWPILIIAAVTIGLVVSAAGTETRLQIEYVSSIQEHAVQMARNGEALRGVADRLEILARDELVTVSEGILGDLQEAMDFVEGDLPVSSVIPVRSLFRQALVAWSTGVDGFYTALLNASDNPEDVTALDEVAAAMAALRAGDALYDQLLTELEHDDLPTPLSPFPPVVMDPGSGGLVSQANRFVTAARSETNSLTLRPGLRISSVVAEPEWQLDANNEAVMRATETVMFSVVVSNMGNVGSDTHSVVLTVTGGANEERQTLEVDALLPGLQTTLVFESIAVDPGGRYVVTATLQGVTEDTDFTDNELTVEFTVNTD